MACGLAGQRAGPCWRTDERPERSAEYRRWRAAGQVRAGLALPRPGRAVPRRQPARRGRVRHQARGLRRPGRGPARARRLLPPHGRRPEPRLRQGRLGRLPVSRLALGRGRQVHEDPVLAAGAAGGADALLADARAEPAAVHLARPAGQPASRGDHHPADRRRLLGGLVRLDLGQPDRGRQLPRGRRQRRGHGALLLHPLRVPDLLPQRLRGPHRQPVPQHQVAAGL